MARIARRGNVRAIRPGLSIPQQRDEDNACITTARLVSVFAASAHRLAQSAPNSEDHYVAEHMAGMGHKLPRNNLRLLVTPQQPKEEWFRLAYKDYCVAKGVRDLAEARFSRAWCLDQWDKGDRAEALRSERDRAQAALDIVILDALRTPVTRKWDIAIKQQMVGKREWAAKYRPEMQAIIDEEAARLASKPRRSRKEAGK
ncbi:hypothetical protein GGQ80_003225 [Sphingomonas jinjuensis]|uniref:Uncharacterized protein n=1 Tax=Sphingomonas jinjuensis TaxID=535907 RepID=A0A840FPV1_9SPHN|nr:hypothetical protein [Sphingomonas jinjuensis]MBB4155305.1 hypothetical protein [Sphingomonas jinjuensis]